MIERLLGAAPNQIHFIQGRRKALANTLIAARLLRTQWRTAIELLPAALRAPRRTAALAALLEPYKYVSFNGSLFVDCFYPRFPGKIFERLMGILLRDLLLTPERWSPATFALILSITRKCVYRCEHCYAIQTLGSRDVLTRADLLHIARSFAELGVGVIAWEGGEPLMRFEDLLALVREMRAQTEATLATTAWGLTPAKARALREAGLVSAIISLDHYEPDKHNQFRKNRKAFDVAVNGVRVFREAGILPSLCICATREIFAEDGLYRYLELARQVGVGFVQVLDATPSGNYLGQDVALSTTQLEEIKRFHRKVNTDPAYRDYPSISSRALLEGDEQYGCAAGNGLCYVDSAGNLQACDLLQISFGNVLEEGVETVHARMKEHFPCPTRGRCPAQSLARPIAAAHAAHGKLPLPHTECSAILERIRRRGPPSHLRPHGVRSP